MSKYVMALDAGTTSNRCILFNKKGEICSVTQREFTQYFPKPGWVEHDPEAIWETERHAAATAVAEAGVPIAAIGITNQRETTIVWEKATGNPIYNAIVWQCRRTAEICDSIASDEVCEEITEKTGLKLDAYFSGTKIKWILDNVPGTRERGAGRAAFRHGGNMAHLEADQGRGSCDGLFQRLPNHAVQHP